MWSLPCTWWLRCQLWPRWSDRPDRNCSTSLPQVSPRAFARRHTPKPTAVPASRNDNSASSDRWNGSASSSTLKQK